MAKKDDPKEIHELKFKYQFPEDYRPVYTNAVWGGINPRGDLEIHFLYDRHPLPLYSVHDVKEGTLLGTPKSVEKGDSVLRFVQTGVVMSADAAKSFYAWLGEKIKVLEDISETGES